MSFLFVCLFMVLFALLRPYVAGECHSSSSVPVRCIIPSKMSTSFHRLTRFFFFPRSNTTCLIPPSGAITPFRYQKKLPLLPLPSSSIRHSCPIPALTPVSPVPFQRQTPVIPAPFRHLPSAISVPFRHPTPSVPSHSGVWQLPHSAVPHSAI